MMDDAIFYREWLPLDKKEFRILAMLADYDGEYHGNLTDMCRYFSISAQQKTRTALREAIQNLTEHNFIESSLSGRTFHLRLIPTDNEISLPRNWLTRLRQHKYSADSVSWEVIVKVILWLEENGQDVITKEGYVSVVDDAKAYAGSKPAGKIVIAGSSSVSPVMEKLVEAYKQINTGAEIELQTQDSSSGIKAAISGTCQIAMSSRDLKDDEKESLTPQKIALDGIAVVGSTSNPTDNLTLDQIKGLYDGSITTWELK